MKYCILIFALMTLYGEEERIEIDSGSKWDVEFLIYKKPSEQNKLFVQLINRSDKDVRIETSLEPGIGEDFKPAKCTALIGRRAYSNNKNTIVYSGRFEKPSFMITFLESGKILSYDTPYYDSKGKDAELLKNRFATDADINKLK